MMRRYIMQKSNKDLIFCIKKIKCTGRIYQQKEDHKSTFGDYLTKK